MQEEQHCVQLFCPVNNLSLTAVLNWFNLKVVCAGGGAALLACYNSQWGRHENADKKVTVILVFTILYWKSSESALKTNWNPTFCEETNNWISSQIWHLFCFLVSILLFFWWTNCSAGRGHYGRGHYDRGHWSQIWECKLEVLVHGSVVTIPDLLTSIQNPENMKTTDIWYQVPWYHV